MTQDLTTLRKKIDKIDVGILALLDQRMRLAIEISKAKHSIKKSIFDPERERALLAKLIEKNKETIIPDEKLLEIWGKIIELSKDTQNLDQKLAIT